MTENKKIIKKPEHEIIKDAIVKEVVSINHGNPGDAQVRPNMAVVLIGEDKTSNNFVDNLEKEAIKVGIDAHIYKCPGNSDEEEVRAMIECLNDDDLIDGIYLHLPLPEIFDQEAVLSLIKTDKELNFVLEGDIKENKLKEAKLFKEALDNFKNRRIDSL